MGNKEQLVRQERQRLLADIEALTAKVAETLQSWDWSRAELSRRPGAFGALLPRIATLRFAHCMSTRSLRLTSSGELYVYDYVCQSWMDLRDARLSTLVDVRSTIEYFLTRHGVPD